MKVKMLSKVVNDAKAVAKDYATYYKTANDALKKFNKQHPVASAIATGVSLVSSVYLANPDFWNETISDGINTIKEKMNSKNTKADSKDDDMKDNIVFHDDIVVHYAYLEYLRRMSVKYLTHELNMVESVILLEKVKLSRTDNAAVKEAVSESLKNNQYKYDFLQSYINSAPSINTVTDTDESAVAESYRYELYNDYIHTTIGEYKAYLQILSKSKLNIEMNNLCIAVKEMRQLLGVDDSIEEGKQQMILRELELRLNAVRKELQKVQGQYTKYETKEI